MNLKSLFCPDSIAVVGASDRPGSFGCNAALNSLKSHTDQVYFVNPRKEELHGRKVYPSLGDLPEPVDCVMICTPQKAVNGILQQAADLGVKSAVIFASGFSEEHTEEGIHAEEEMKAIAAKAGMAVLGPNCAGLLNNVDKRNLWGMACSFDMETRRTGIGVLAQSGFVAMSVMGHVGLNLSYVVSSGNGKIVMLEDYLDYMVKDDSVKVIALYLEGVRDSVKFTQSLKEAALRRKPIVVLKAGKSDLGAEATASHTGNMAGSSKAYQAVFQKYGVIEVDCMEELLCVAQMFSVLHDRMPKNSGIFGLNSSGGANAICADLCDLNEICLPKLTDEEKEEIRNYIPSFATPGNPLDVTTNSFGDVENTYGLLCLLERMDKIGGVTIGNSIDIKEGKVSVGICEALLEARRRGLKKPYFMVPSVEGTPSARYKALLEENGIVLMSSAKTAYRCLSLFLGFLEYHPERHNLDGIGRAVEPRGKKVGAITEYEAKQLLKQAGVPVGNEIVVRSAEEMKHTAGLFSYPLAMKVSSRDILHKTDCGGVRLSVKTPEEAEQAFSEILEDCRENCPDAEIDGVLVGSMAKPGVEIILGVKNDAQFGPLLLVGLGGVFVEVFRDVALTPCPVSREEALDLLGSLKAKRLLNGYRGSAPKDVDALADLIVKVSEFAAQEKELQEMDLNPVFVYDKGEGLQVVDALMLTNSDRESTVPLGSWPTGE
ncbi:acetate--CoA ligase family protein [Hominifimenecus sp. rT4P-3]|uniref:acetate--CoA ligase family protein n=1 Tax=Hominifimenecus sp. rT4P-3 TaxID=3242979 RepID=UPI003DA3D667